MNDVFEEVQGVLLDSEGGPESAVQAALLAVVQFASTECDATPAGLRAMFAEVLAEEFGA